MESYVYPLISYCLLPLGRTNPRSRHDYRAVSSKVDAQLYKDVFHFWHEIALKVRNTTGANQTFVLQNVPKSLVAQAHAKGGNPLNIPDFTHQCKLAFTHRRSYRIY